MKDCCLKFEILRNQVIARVELVRRLTNGNPRMLVWLYEELTKSIHPKLLERLASPYGDCPCGAAEERITKWHEDLDRAVLESQKQRQSKQSQIKQM